MFVKYLIINYLSCRVNDDYSLPLIL